MHIDITDRIRATQRVEALQQITEVALTRATSLQDLMNSLVAILQSTFAADTAAILLFDQDHGDLQIHAGSGLDFSGPQPARFPRFIARVLRANRPVLIEDTSKDQDVRELARAQAAAAGRHPTLVLHRIGAVAARGEPGSAAPGKPDELPGSVRPGSEPQGLGAPWAAGAAGA